MIVHQQVATEMSPKDVQASIDALYDQMRVLVERHSGQPGLRQALKPLREKLRALQETEALQIAARYDSRFQAEYDKAQALIAEARELLR